MVKFKKYGFLANESAKTGRLITIANWVKYQSNDEEVAKQAAKRWQRGGKEVATNKNVKNVENIDQKNVPEMALFYCNIYRRRI
ncbi:regulatory protein [Lactobacillus phage iLp1308]|uniref:Regulatory protein n=1 Tax=Lactobacillus phage iLp1308 TaxID=1739611 RepID=A0A0P0IK17_9CAUD|nr:regulatory protein [Lactobacillus phage iLp1308]ALJ97927.1 regulatory protein [Lactobacillus phage iLp1308]